MLTLFTSSAHRVGQLVVSYAENYAATVVPILLVFVPTTNNNNQYNTNNQLVTATRTNNNNSKYNANITSIIIDTIHSTITNNDKEYQQYIGLYGSLYWLLLALYWLVLLLLVIGPRTSYTHRYALLEVLLLLGNYY